MHHLILDPWSRLAPVRLVRWSLIPLMGMSLGACGQKSDSPPSQDGTVPAQAPASAPAAESTHAFRVLQVEGEAWILRDTADTSPQALKVGQRLHEGNVVQTSQESRTVLEVDPGHRFTIEENSALRIQSSLARHEAVQLDVGSLLFDIRKLAVGSQLKMDTRTMSAAVRGTKGGIVASERTSAAYLESGTLDLSHKGNQSLKRIGARQSAVQDRQGFAVQSAKDSNDLRQLVRRARTQVFDQRTPAALEKLPPLPGRFQELMERQRIRHRDNLQQLDQTRSKLEDSRNALQSKAQSTQQKLEQTRKEQEDMARRKLQQQSAKAKDAVRSQTKSTTDQAKDQARKALTKLRP